jgi:hypothetical protein
MMDTFYPLTTSQLEAGLEYIRQSPKDQGVLELIVCRPVIDERAVLGIGELTQQDGLVGDNWLARGGPRKDGAPPDEAVQLTLINTRLIDLVAQSRNRWPTAGDQLYMDLDLGLDNLPTGSRLAIGNAIIEITAPPHLGCSKFSSRFGIDALRFVNSPMGKQLRLRGAHARVVQPGHIRPGDLVRKVE